MPADHMILRPGDQLAAAAQAVLTGRDLSTVAAEYGFNPIDLDDAVRLYHAAGLTALERHAEQGWYDIRVEFPDWATAETPATTRLAPALDALCADGLLTGWWFLRKYPCWRLRLRNANAASISQVLDDLTVEGHLTRWWPTIYEPETAAFGGMTGIAIVHDLYCTDSRGVLRYVRNAKSDLGRRELSILLLTGLFHGAGLDIFERGDIFDRVTCLRPTPTTVDVAKIDYLAAVLRPVVTLSNPSRIDLFDKGAPAAGAIEWLAAFERAGDQLGHAAKQGNLGRGLRGILTHIVIFHWNRLGLSATSQAVLARAATTALLPTE